LYSGRGSGLHHSGISLDCAPAIPAQQTNASIANALLKRTIPPVLKLGRGFLANLSL